MKVKKERVIVNGVDVTAHVYERSAADIRAYLRENGLECLEPYYGLSATPDDPNSAGDSGERSDTQEDEGSIRPS